MMHNLNYIRKNSPEAGNLFFIIFAAIAMFAALTFTISRSSNNKSTDLLSQKEAQLAASRITAYTQNIARAVFRVMNNNGCSENQISFEPPPIDDAGDYYNSNAPSDFSCHIFHISGGAATYKTFPENWRSTGSGIITPLITGDNCIPDIGTGSTSACISDDDTTNSDLIIIIQPLKDNICEAINNDLDLTLTAEELDVFLVGAEYEGTFGDEHSGSTDTTHLTDNFTATQTACIPNTSNTNQTYKILLAR